MENQRETQTTTVGPSVKTRETTIDLEVAEYSSTKYRIDTSKKIKNFTRGASQGYCAGRVGLAVLPMGKREAERFLIARSTKAFQKDSRYLTHLHHALNDFRLRATFGTEFERVSFEETVQLLMLNPSAGSNLRRVHGNDINSVYSRLRELPADELLTLEQTQHITNDISWVSLNQGIHAVNENRLAPNTNPVYGAAPHPPPPLPPRVGMSPFSLGLIIVSALLGFGGVIR